MLCAGIATLLPGQLLAQYAMRASVLGGGGAVSSNSTHRLASTMGQAVAGFSAGGSFRKRAGFWSAEPVPTPVEHTAAPVPREYRLDQNFPNPFNPATTIRFAIKEKSHVSLVVFTLLGQAVSTIVDEELPAGEYETRFTAPDAASGLYFYRLTSNGFVRSRKMLLLR